MSEGFLMLRRTAETFELLRDTNAFILLTVIALRAQRTSGFNIHGLQCGQALLGDHERYGMSPRQYRTAKRHLAQWGLAGFKTTSRGTVATLCGKSIYDINEATEGQTDDKQMTTARQANDKHTTTTNNENNEKNENKWPDDSDPLKGNPDNSGSGVTSPDDFDAGKDCRDGSEAERLARLLFDLIRRRKPDMHPPDLSGWAQGVAGMIRRDGRRPERIEAVIRWCQQDSFWRNNILNIRSLRRHFDRLELQMTPPGVSESTQDMVERMEREGKL